MGGPQPLNGPVLILGASGMLGRAMVAAVSRAGQEARTLSPPRLDLTDPASIDAAIDGSCPLVINCTAYTDVDGAESHEELARGINATGVGRLARRCAAAGATLVHYSTDYVFDGAGSSPYPTDHPRRPINAYGRTKARGEEAVEQSSARFLILRTSWLYAPWGRNFVRTIARVASERPTLRVVNDQRGRPTSAESLAELTLAMLRAGATGTHHATDDGECTWFEFAGAIVDGLGLPCTVEPCTTAEFPRPAARPAYSVLDLSRTRALIGPIPSWRERLADVLNRLERPL